MWSPSAGRRFCRVQSRYAYPAGAYFCMRKSRQNALGAVPQDPLTLKLRLDTNDAKASSVQRRRYALQVPAAHFMLGNCKPIAESHAAETVGKTSSYLPRRPLPRCGGGVGGAEPSAASGGCSEAEHPQRSKKLSKRAARRFFRAPQGGRGGCCRRLPLERICAQYGFGFFSPEKSKFVASTAKRQRGLSRGKLGPP